MSARRTKTIRVFFRNDDVGTDEDAYAAALRLRDETPGQLCGDPVPERLQRLVEIFDSLQLPLDLSIIPVFLNAKLADWLQKAAAGLPIALMQHGWTHKDHGCREFGPCRTYEQQHRDILRGKQFLEQVLGGAFSPIFVPPSNYYDQTSIRVLNELGFTGLSAGFARDWLRFAVIQLGRSRGWASIYKYPISLHEGSHGRVAEFSVTVDVVQNYFSGRAIKPLKQLIADFQRARRFTSIVGVMLHHWTLRHADEWNVLREFLQHLKVQENIEFVSLKELCPSNGELRPESSDQQTGNRIKD